MAYTIVSGLKKSGKVVLLRKMQQGVGVKERQKGKKHQVFHLSFDARKCFSEKMIEQKLDLFAFGLLPMKPQSPGDR